MLEKVFINILLVREESNCSNVTPGSVCFDVITTLSLIEQ